MTPWSTGCENDIMLGGKKINLMFDISTIVGCAGQLSIIKAIFQFSFWNFTSSSRTHSLERVLSIQLFFWDLYLHGKDVTFLKHLGAFDFPITNIGSLPPTQLAAARPVILILLFLQPEHFSNFKWSVLFGRHWWKRPNSSALNISSSL